MVDLFDIIHDYRMLRAKSDSLDIPLDDAERARLAGLERLLRGDVPGADEERDNRVMPRLPSPIPVHFTAPAGFETGRIRNVSGGGMAILTSRPAPIGAHTLIRLIDDDRGVEYLFPARVVWRTGGARPGMGVAFDGLPTRTRIGEQTHVSWRPGLRFGSLPRSSMLA